MYRYIATALAVLTIAGCSLTVVDPRSSDVREATHVAMTEEAYVELPTVTPTPEPPPLPTSDPQVLPELCVVKGNVTRSGEKIFHVEGQANYKNVIIDPEHGEACFATEGEAVHAGFRKALR